MARKHFVCQQRVLLLGRRAASRGERGDRCDRFCTLARHKHKQNKTQKKYRAHKHSRLDRRDAERASERPFIRTLIIRVRCGGAQIEKYFGYEIIGCHTRANMPQTRHKDHAAAAAAAQRERFLLPFQAFGVCVCVRFDDVCACVFG